MDKQIKEFLEDWNKTRARTLKFLDSVPAEKWTWKPHVLLGSFGMQVRHMIHSQESYIDGINSGTVNFEKKPIDKEIEVKKETAIKKLKEVNNQLSELLESQDPKKEIRFIDGVTGESKDQLITVLLWLQDHEFYHQGIFTCYGRLAGLGKFTFM